MGTSYHDSKSEQDKSGAALSSVVAAVGLSMLKVAPY